VVHQFPSRRGGLVRLVGLLIGVSLGCGMPSSTYGQAESAGVYQKSCAKCHGTDGTGKPARAIDPEIPDFSAAAWQKRRTDAQLLVSILDGKGSSMPTFRGKLNDKQARGLVAHVRSFAPANPDKPAPKDADAGSFTEQFRRLQEQFDQLREQLRVLSEPGDAAGMPPPDAGSELHGRRR
jgi:cytochrome c553